MLIKTNSPLRQLVKIKVNFSRNSEYIRLYIYFSKSPRSKVAILILISRTRVLESTELSCCARRSNIDMTILDLFVGYNSEYSTLLICISWATSPVPWVRVSQSLIQCVISCLRPSSSFDSILVVSEKLMDDIVSDPGCHHAKDEHAQQIC